MRLGGGVGYVGRLVGNCAIFFFLGVFWLPLRKVVYRIADFIPSEKCHLSCFWAGTNSGEYPNRNRVG